MAVVTLWKKSPATVTLWKGPPAQVPVVLGVSPAVGSFMGGTAVTLTGYGFTGANAVFFGSTSVVPLTVTDTTITCLTPAGAVGAVSVTVANAGYTSAPLVNAFMYNAFSAPTVTSVNKSIVDASGGSSVTFTGTNLAATSAAAFGVTGATITGTTPTTVTVTAPAKTASVTPSDFTVTTPGGTATLAACVEFFWPTNITGCVQWLRGDRGVGLTTGRVTTWSDQSGAGFNLTSASARPPAPVTGINGKPAIGFLQADNAGFGDELSSASVPVGLSGAAAVEGFMVAQSTSTGTAGQGLWSYGTGGTEYFPFSDGNLYENFATSLRYATTLGSGSYPDLTLPFVVDIQANASSWALLINGVTAIVKGTNTVGISSTVRLGAGGIVGSGGLPFDGTVSEVAIYGRGTILTSGERARINAYFADLYATTYLMNLDFSAQAASYVNLTYARTGNSAVAALSASTATTIAAAVPLYENRGDGITFGLWTFASFTNNAAQDLTTWATVNSVSIATLAGGTAPDGTSAAQSVNDTDATHVAGITFAVSSGGRVQSVWVRDHSGTPPTAPGMLGSNTSGAGVSLGAGSTWRRVSYVDIATGAVTSMQIFPAGAQPGGTTPSATGAVDLWAPSSVAEAETTPPYGGSSDYPTILGSTGASILQVNAHGIVEAGDLDIEGGLVAMWSGIDSLFVADTYLFSATSSDGLMGLRFKQQVSGAHQGFIFSVRGTDVVTLSDMYFTAGDEITWRAWYRISTGKWGVRIGINGSYTEAFGSTTGSALAAPTSAYVGSNLGASGHFTAIHSAFRAHHLTDIPAPAPEFIGFGDSIGSGFDYARAPFDWIYARDITRRSKPGVVNQSIGGQQIAAQKAIWDAGPNKGQSYVKACVLQVGINDLLIGGASLGTWVASYQGLINDIKASNPSAKIIACELSPCRAYMVSIGQPSYYAVWQAINTAFTNGSITGIDVVVSSHVAALNDGSGNLASQYDVSGDGLHPSDSGRQIIGLAMRSALLGLGLVT